MLNVFYSTIASTGAVVSFLLRLKVSQVILF